MIPWFEFWGLFLQVWIWLGAVVLVLGLIAGVAAYLGHSRGWR